jgi:CYTH domain-containing protein
MRYIKTTAEIALTQEDVQMAIEEWLNKRLIGDNVYVQQMRVNPGNKYLVRVQLGHDKEHE